MELAIVVITGFFILTVVYRSVTACTERHVMQTRARHAFMMLDMLLQQRYDVIAALADLARLEFTPDDRELLQPIVNANNQARQAARQAVNLPEDPRTIQQLIHAEKLLRGAVATFCATLARYPAMPPHEAFEHLAETLLTIERRLEFARQTYNDMATAATADRRGCIVHALTEPFSGAHPEPFDFQPLHTLVPSVRTPH